MAATRLLETLVEVVAYARSIIDSDAGDSYGNISDGDRLVRPLFICGEFN